MDCFSKLEVAGLVEVVAHDREYKKLRLQINVPPEGLDMITADSDMLSEKGYVELLEVEIVDEAYELLLGKVYDFDYIHVLADVVNAPFKRIPVKFITHKAGQIICHKPHAYLNKEDKGKNIYRALEYGVIK